ncbi:MAG: N-acetyltransferase [Bacteroidales bacterium]|nr:N-acetyltransferase [Bacteroidales bacterium]
MAVTVKQVHDRKALRAFVEFPNRLYKGVSGYVPKLVGDEMDTLSPDKNPSCRFSDLALFLAYRDGEIVGRVAAIINRRANERWNHQEVRFGWIDFIDDDEVSKALLDKVAEFGKQHGMDTLVGPLGFTDFDPEGMLVDGYDYINTMALIYNYPYYPEHMERLGLTKEVDWVEYKIYIPKQVPERIVRLADIVQKKTGYHLLKLTKKNIRDNGYGRKLFAAINATYQHLYNFTILPDDVIDHYVDTYLGVIDMKFLSIVVDGQGEIAAFAVSMPSITRALQKCGGHLFPTGWFHILRSLYVKHEESVELMMVGVLPEHKNKGLLAMLFNDLIPRYIEAGFEYGETNAELESNLAMQTQWDMFEKEQTKRRRIFKKAI